MLNLSTVEFNGMLSESNKKIKRLKSELSILNLSIEQLSRKKKETKEDLEAQEDKSEAIQKALILVRGVSLEISHLRNQLLRKKERAGREDITIAENKNLSTEIETLTTELQKVCSHPFVYDEPGYEGSHSYDYENRCPGVRYCIVCGFSEETYQSREDGHLGLERKYLFKNLTQDDKRIIQEQPWTPEGRKRVNIWIPLGAVLKPFEDSVAKVLNS